MDAEPYKSTKYWIEVARERKRKIQKIERKSHEYYEHLVKWHVKLL